MRTIISTTLSLVVCSLAAIGCGASAGGSRITGNDNTDSPSGGSSAVSAAGSTSTGQAGTLALMTTPSGGMEGVAGGAPLVADMACATGTASASLSGVNMIVMFDRSGSMRQAATTNGPSRWELTSSALKSFFASPDAAGLKLALRFFPHDQPMAGCNDSACDATACTTPLVPLAGLTKDPAPADAQEKALIDATDNSAPGQGSGGGTPTSAALAGALDWAKAQHQLTPTETSVVVLVTDGQPHGCDEDINNISKLASDAFASDMVRTYAIGLTGSREADMDTIAMAGGTTKGIFVSDGASTQQDLLDALAAIRGQVLDCDFPLPAAKPGTNVDPSLVNVNVTTGAGVKTTLPQVADEASCSTTQGWYYDNPTAPTRIALCKSSCDSVTVDVMASIQVLLGCNTVKVPK